jgi:hypothetical protein
MPRGATHPILDQAVRVAVTEEAVHEAIIVKVPLQAISSDSDDEGGVDAVEAPHADVLQMDVRELLWKG